MTAEEQEQALRVLRTLKRTRASYFGSALWGVGRIRQPQHFARPAWRLLVALEAKGLVVRERDRDGTYWRLKESTQVKIPGIE